MPIQILQEVPTAATIILDDIIHTFEGFLAKNQEASFDRTTFFFSVSASGIVFCMKGHGAALFSQEHVLQSV